MPQVSQVPPEHKATQVPLALLVNKAPPVHKALPDHKDLQEPTVPLVSLDQLGHKDRKDQLDKMEAAALIMITTLTPAPLRATPDPVICCGTPQVVHKKMPRRSTSVT